MCRPASVTWRSKRPGGGRRAGEPGGSGCRSSDAVEGIPVDGQPAQVVTETQNISASGVYCRSSHFLSPFSKVDLTIVLPQMPGVRSGKELLKCEGIVVRCDPATARRGDKGFQLACMFSDIGPRHRELLEEFVTWRNLQALRAAAAAAQGERPKRPRAAATKARARAAAGARRKAAPRRRTAR